MQAVTPLDGAALAGAVVEIERHLNATGWDQPVRLFALVPTADLLAAEPKLAAALGAASGQALTSVAQDELPDGMDDEHLASALARVEWPAAVAGCAVAVERLVLPGRDEDGEEGGDEGGGDGNARRAGGGPAGARAEVRMVAGVLRSGDRFGAVRLRDHDDDTAVLTGADLVPTLCEVLALTLEPAGGREVTSDGNAGSVGDEEETGS